MGKASVAEKQRKVSRNAAKNRRVVSQIFVTLAPQTCQQCNSLSFDVATKPARNRFVTGDGVAGHEPAMSLVATI